MRNVPGEESRPLKSRRFIVNRDFDVCCDWFPVSECGNKFGALHICECCIAETKERRVFAYHLERLQITRGVYFQLQFHHRVYSKRRGLGVGIMTSFKFGIAAPKRL